MRQSHFSMTIPGQILATINSIRFDRDDLTRADLTARATAISSLISSRTLSPNEGRSWLGLAPREGGNVFENPNTGSNQPSGAAPQEAPNANA
jgi:hypothetical protein